MKNTHVLPTEKPSRLSILNSGKLNFGAEFISSSNSKAQHIYITNSKEIKVGEWVIYTKGIKIHCKKLDNKEDVELANIENSGVLKIILTTDQDLIKDGVQAIDDEFLEWFVNKANDSGKPIDIVEVKTSVGRYSYDMGGNIWIPISYKIIIPKEEPKQETLEEAKQGTMSEAIKKAIDTQLKQETLEESELRQLFKNRSNCYADADDVVQAMDEDCFIETIKEWQSKKMFSDEEVDRILRNFRTDFLPLGQINDLTLNNWFKQFKKK